MGQHNHWDEHKPNMSYEAYGKAINASDSSYEIMHSVHKLIEVVRDAPQCVISMGDERQHVMFQSAINLLEAWMEHEESGP